MGSLKPLVIVTAAIGHKVTVRVSCLAALEACFTTMLGEPASSATLWLKKNAGSPESVFPPAAFTNKGLSYLFLLSSFSRSKLNMSNRSPTAGMLRGT
jgi:hypothetical protein